MKLRPILITAATFCLLVATLFAATKQWSVMADGQIYQVVGDDKGGCAFVWVSTSMVATVVWVDKKGAVQHQETLSTGAYPFAIAQCTPKQLMYLRETPAGYELVQIDKKGQETVLPTTGDVTVNGGFPYALTRPIDKKGFFAISIDTNTPANSSELTRYSNK
jgi:hypothetical protein